ncbi:uncharacterized protein LOC124197253 [Daphnia pulex]|uniref:uncharacterized protein LOC124197253 n=1 Tax=Daphnia pulex TaxID=6669 RepID=UPI001EDE1055|nr:uncharacterized protein LOC124197253 [Daphnia pulex]
MLALEQNKVLAVAFLFSSLLDPIFDHCVKMPKMPVRTIQQRLVDALKAHAKHDSLRSRFEPPRIDDEGKLVSKCLKCKGDYKINGGSLKAHTEKACRTKIEKSQGPNPTVQEPTLAEVQEENRQLRAQLQVIPVLEEEIRKLQAKLQVPRPLFQVPEEVSHPKF